MERIYFYPEGNHSAIVVQKENENFMRSSPLTIYSTIRTINDFLNQFFNKKSHIKYTLEINSGTQLSKQYITSPLVIDLTSFTCTSYYIYTEASIKFVLKVNEDKIVTYRLEYIKADGRIKKLDLYAYDEEGNDKIVHIFDYTFEHDENATQLDILLDKIDEFSKVVLPKLK